MNIKDYNYHLPKELIAQTPLEKRDTSRLLVLNRKNETLKHTHFFTIVDYLDEHDVLVINDTKVLPARIKGVKKITNAHIELLLLEEIEKDTWDALTKPQRRVKVGDVVVFNNLEARCVAVKEEGINTYKMVYQGIFLEILESIGTMPIPPYIHEHLENQDRYQTIYATKEGSSAAPTAGLHFTKDVLEKLRLKGVEVIKITLHVGLGTFKPMSDTIEAHTMHSEKYHISKEACESLNRAKGKKNIVAVGTTTLRALEANYNQGFHEGSFQTNIFIYPPYHFKAVDKLITNFHLPKSSLLLLVSAFSSKELIFKTYQEAIKEKYRFFSFGDVMFIE